MAKKGKKETKKLELRQQRVFSEEFKRQKVQLLVEKRLTVKELSELYQVSKMSVYRWLYQYSVEAIRQGISEYLFTMKELYLLVGFSKQAHWEWQQRCREELDKWLLLEPVLSEWRSRHPSMGLKKLYYCIQPDFIGRDKFIDYAIANNFEAVRYAKAPKTTVLSEKKDYPNLLIDLIINDINQVWVSDTTYFKIHNKWHYLTFIMDLYSRRILGFHAAHNLLAQANLACLKMALTERGLQHHGKLIHHSDRGSQYKSKPYIKALNEAGIKVSMGRIVYDNIHMERFNQTSKGEYLIHRNIRNEVDLKMHLITSVWLYDNERPHDALNNMTPSLFERYISNIPLCQRTSMKVFAFKGRKKINSNLSVFIDPNQLALPI